MGGRLNVSLMRVVMVFMRMKIMKWEVMMRKYYLSVLFVVRVFKI